MLNVTLTNFTPDSFAPMYTQEQFDYFTHLCTNAHISIHNTDIIIAIFVVLLCEVGEMILQREEQQLTDRQYQIVYDGLKIFKICAWVVVMIRMWWGA